MPETTEIPIEVLPAGKHFGSTGSNVIIALATYGAVSLTHDATRLAKRFHANWKTKQELKAQQNEPKS